MEEHTFLYTASDAHIGSRFNDANGNARGFLSFYAVHGTSLYENNTLVSTDNKGMAAYLYENEIEPNSMPGNTTFVAGFVQCTRSSTSCPFIAC
jgi:neutral ceramidase